MPETIATCKTCGTDYEHGLNGAYCSSDCFHRQKGKNILRDLKHDHTVCGSCGRVRAEVITPKPKEAFAIDWSYDSGYEAHADGSSSFVNWGQEESHKSAIGFRIPTENEPDGCCKCGTIGKQDTHRFLRDVEPERVCTLIYNRVRELYESEAIDRNPDESILRRTYQQESDMALAVGRSLHL